MKQKLYRQNSEVKNNVVSFHSQPKISPEYSSQNLSDPKIAQGWIDSREFATLAKSQPNYSVEFFNPTRIDVYSFQDLLTSINQNKSRVDRVEIQLAVNSMIPNKHSYNIKIYADGKPEPIEKVVHFDNNWDKSYINGSSDDLTKMLTQIGVANKTVNVDRYDSRVAVTNRMQALAYPNQVPNYTPLPTDPNPRIDSTISWDEVIRLGREKIYNQEISALFNDVDTSIKNLGSKANKEEVKVLLEKIDKIDTLTRNLPDYATDAYNKKYSDLPNIRNKLLRIINEYDPKIDTMSLQTPTASMKWVISNYLDKLSESIAQKAQ